MQFFQILALYDIRAGLRKDPPMGMIRKSTTCKTTTALTHLEETRECDFG